MLKIAGVKSPEELLRKYKTEEDFFRQHPEANMLKYAAMGGNYYDDGGIPPETMQQQGPPPGVEQGQPQGGGGEDQMQQIVQFITQALQQGMQPEEIIQKLVEAGLPEDQAGQILQAVMQQLQSGGGQQQGAPPQGPQEEMMEGPQGQEPPPQEMAEGQPPMGMYGGGYAYGGAYANVPQHGRPGTYGGYSGTSSAGQYFAQGGPFIPEYGNSAWNTEYATGGETLGNQLIMQVAQLLQQGVKPEVVLQQLVQAKIPQKKAIKIIQTVMEKLQGAQQGVQQAAPQEQMMAYGGPYMELSNRGNTTNFAYGGATANTKKYKKGGEYEMSHQDVQDLINKGYKIQYL